MQGYIIKGLVRLIMISVLFCLWLLGSGLLLYMAFGSEFMAL